MYVGHHGEITKSHSAFLLTTTIEPRVLASQLPDRFHCALSSDLEAPRTVAYGTSPMAEHGVALCAPAGTFAFTRCLISHPVSPQNTPRDLLRLVDAVMLVLQLLFREISNIRGLFLLVFCLSTWPHYLSTIHRCSWRTAPLPFDHIHDALHNPSCTPIVRRAIALQTSIQRNQLALF